MFDIPMYNTFKICRLIEKGMSGDKKYYIETDKNKHLLLRIADISEYDQKKSEYKLMKEFALIDVPMPKVIDFGVCNGNKNVYTLLEWIDGQVVEELVPKIDNDKQYLLGYKSGKILRLIHSLPSNKDISNWSSRYFTVIEERLHAFHREGIFFEGCDKIISFLEENKGLLNNRPQCFHHGDFHMGNMINTDHGDLFIIDWHTVDFDNYGDPWYEFNRIGTEYPAFASGQIDGYFEGNPPDSFWMLLAYYLSASAITSIVWAKYYAPECLNTILQLNSDILVWFNEMQNPIPTWYRKGDIR